MSRTIMCCALCSQFSLQGQNLFLFSQAALTEQFPVDSFLMHSDSVSSHSHIPGELIASYIF